MVLKILSGGQTGVDRAALDVALAHDIACGGWCPKGRLAEDGPLAARYPLVETPLTTSSQRTEFNVRDADATLILCHGPLSGGTLKTAAIAQRLAKPFLVIDLAQETSPDAAAEWATNHRARVLNIAGPRESEAPGIYLVAYRFLEKLLVGDPEPTTTA